MVRKKGLVTSNFKDTYIKGLADMYIDCCEQTGNFNSFINFLLKEVKEHEKLIHKK